MKRFDQDTPLKSFIQVYDADIPEGFLEKVLEAIPNDPVTGFAKAMVRNGVVDSQSRKCDTWDVTEGWICEKIWKIMDVVTKDYNERFGSGITKNYEGYKLLRYKTGDYYHTHVDLNTNVYRTMSVVIILNDDYEGGELSFFHGKYDLKPKKNQIVMFPSNFLFPHEVKPVTRGTRYSFVTWVI